MADGAPDECPPATTATMASSNAAVASRTRPNRMAYAVVIDYGFTALDLHRVEAGVLVGNDPSVRVLDSSASGRKEPCATTCT